MARVAASGRSSAPGASSASSPSKSPARAAARNAATTSLRPVPPATGSRGGPCTRRRARLASIFVAAVRDYLRSTSRRRWVLPLWVPGMSKVSRGALLPRPPYTAGRRTFAEYLGESGGHR
ncbi:hypothetical protein [Dactylosporangium sp. CA-139066]|uniref:hypothetical protein n=1 Tax=Dactylosporangium sp. CA-139066 TaxID=3239930 RepID=UPI003D909B5C